MARAPSGPERVAEQLFADLGIELTANDGSRSPEKLYLRADLRGTSVIRGASLYTDVARLSPPGRPKNFKWITPDYAGAGFFVEVKADVSADTWDGLSRDACNDNLRFALLRMRRKAVDDTRAEYEDLTADMRRIVDLGLAPFPQSRPGERVYLTWDNLEAAVPSPRENLQRTVIAHSGRELPIKVVAGGATKDIVPLYILDHDVMTEWRALVS